MPLQLRWGKFGLNGDGYRVQADGRGHLVRFWAGIAGKSLWNCWRDPLAGPCAGIERQRDRLSERIRLTGGYDLLFLHAGKKRPASPSFISYTGLQINFKDSPVAPQNPGSTANSAH